MVITIKDDFDLNKIVYSGQCFRPRFLEDGSCLFITRREYLVINELGENQYDISCDADTWNDVWAEYFDLNIVYSDIKNEVKQEDLFMQNCASISEGVRILKQDKWEMLISYIISQRKSIPAIRTAVEKIARLYGEVLGVVNGEKIYAFPTIEQMQAATAEELAACGLGYRVSYILDAIKSRLVLDELDQLNDDELFCRLKSIKGVGDKVANCVMLFAYHRMGRAPVDTWILKVINEKYNGINPFEQYGEHAGIMQQYVFYAVQNQKELSRKNT